MDSLGDYMCKSSQGAKYDPLKMCYLCLLCVNRHHGTITGPAHNGSLINVWTLPPTVNDENDINNQLVDAQCSGIEC